MPFKTRRQKLTAEERRFSFAETPMSLPTQTLQNTEKAKVKISKPQTSIDDLSYVKFDLVKIFLIASVIITLQIVIALTLF